MRAPPNLSSAPQTSPVRQPNPDPLPACIASGNFILEFSSRRHFFRLQKSIFDLIWFDLLDWLYRRRRLASGPLPRWVCRQYLSSFIQSTAPLTCCSTRLWDNGRPGHQLTQWPLTSDLCDLWSLEATRPGHQLTATQQPHCNHPVTSDLWPVWPLTTGGLEATRPGH